MSGVITLNSENFDDYVLNGKIPALVDFSAQWCGPCKRLFPLLDEISQEYSERIYLCTLDIDEAENIASRYQVSSLPSLLFFLNGEVVDRIVGLAGKEKIREKIESALLKGTSKN